MSSAQSTNQLCSFHNFTALCRASYAVPHTRRPESPAHALLPLLHRQLHPAGQLRDRLESPPPAHSITIYPHAAAHGSSLLPRARHPTPTTCRPSWLSSHHRDIGESESERWTRGSSHADEVTMRGATRSSPPDEASYMYAWTSGPIVTASLMLLMKRGTRICFHSHF